MAGESVLAKMAVVISANAAEFNKQLSSVDGRLKTFSNGLSNTAKALGLAFGVSQVANFAFEVAKLAGEAEGVSAAFNKLPDSERLMNQLKEATAGTVSELELMKRTVQATNFGISLEALPQLLEFAAIRAQQTGQSVDYLVDSIVTGIGRKSPLILDNLGISAVALKEKMGGVSLAAADIGTVSEAVGKIAEDELKKMGGFSENTATQIARLTATWENFKVSVGRSNFIGALSEASSKFLDFFSIILGGRPSTEALQTEFDFLLKSINSGTLSAEQYAIAFKEVFKVADALGIKLIKLSDSASGVSKLLVDTTTKIKVVAGTAGQVETLDALHQKIVQLNKDFEETDVNDKAKLVNIGQEIIGINAQIKALDELRKARESSSVQPNTVNAYQAAVKDLNEELENTNVKDTDRIRILSAQIAGYQQAIQNIERLKKSFQDFDVVLPVPDVSGLLNPIKEIEKTVGALKFTTLSDSMTQVTERFEAGLNKMALVSKTKVEEIKESFIDLGPLISDSLTSIGQALGGAIAGTENFGSAILKVVVGFASQLGKILIATGVAMIAAKKLITNPYTAIIAGIALVALSAAAGAAISNAHSSSFGGGASGGGRGGENVTAVRGVGARPEDRIEGNVTFEIEGTKLVGVLSNANTKKQRTG